MKIDKNIIEQNISEVLKSNYMPYAMSVIMSRAIPEIDGFKPSHRKLLYTMFTMGLLAGNRTKSSNVIGQTMKLNPHGDGAIYETMVRLTVGNETLLLPFVDSKGNFGKFYSKDMAYAAARYTEVKLAKVCEEIFDDIYKDTVDFVDNYDSTMQEPVLLPTKFPNILLSPNQGIAVGMASSICSFNLKEICACTIAYIKNRDIDLTKYLKAPDFSTAGELLYDKKVLEEIYETGRGSVKLRAKYRFDKKNSCIEIFEIPYTTNIEAIIDKVVALVKSSKIKEINAIRDETDLGGLKIAIDIKKAADPDLLMSKLFAQTTLQDSFSCNFNILIDKNPKVMGIKEILDNWLVFRSHSLKKRTAFDIAKKTEKAHLLEGLDRIILDIDRAIKIIRETKEEKSVISNLMDGFEISSEQANYIAEIKLRNLNAEYLLKRTTELSSLYDEIRLLNAILADDEKVKDLIISDLQDVSKKYGEKRKTEIVYDFSEDEFDDAVFVEDFDVHFFLTEQNYLKKISAVSWMRFSEQKLREDDFVVQELDITNKDELLLFSSQNNVFKLKASEIPDHKASILGEYLPNLLDIPDEEKIIFMTPSKDYSGFMIFGFADGKFVKIPLSAYETKTNRKKLVNAYSDKSALVYINFIEEDLDIVIIRDKDKAAIVSTGLLSLKQSRNSVGAKIFNLKKNSRIAKVFEKSNFKSDDPEYYRAKKVPTTGHFLTEGDKGLNGFS